jgi:hypothetical protein
VTGGSGKRLLLLLGLGVGLYGDGDGKDLGYTIEFRSQLQLGCKLNNSDRVSFAFGHISNVGIGDLNPGTNISTVYYHVPLRKFRSK